jgi:hypothetical protein
MTGTKANEKKQLVRDRNNLWRRHLKKKRAFISLSKVR